MRQTIVVLVAMHAAIIITAFPVAAEGRKASSSDSLPKILLALALDNYPNARCGNNQPCAPATAEERERPPLTDEQAHTIVTAASTSAIARHCGLDWQRRNFEPLMRFHRETLKLSERQMALVGLLHGISMGVMAEPVARGPCIPALKASAEKHMLLKE